ncbi:transposase [Streptomyces sp. RLB3-17]|nr:transposase [Streptomyces sp. RLB1-9]QDO25083.1 transposase [Streptomyces sp. S1A1-8]QDO35204.1 transposase [Streptomyces sp. S1A1-3]QDO45219.1 transposase [Streptomyces sp. RLB3-17]
MPASRRLLRSSSGRSWRVRRPASSRSTSCGSRIGRATSGASAELSHRAHRHRTGVPWRELPARFGKGRTAYARHRRWSSIVPGSEAPRRAD